MQRAVLPQRILLALSVLVRHHHPVQTSTMVMLMKRTPGVQSARASLIQMVMSWTISTVREQTMMMVV